MCVLFAAFRAFLRLGLPLFQGPKFNLKNASAEALLAKNLHKHGSRNGNGFTNRPK